MLLCFYAVPYFCGVKSIAALVFNISLYRNEPENALLLRMRREGSYTIEYIF